MVVQMRHLPIPAVRGTPLPLIALAVVAVATLFGTGAHAQRHPRRVVVMSRAQAERLFEQATQAAVELGRVEIQPGDANGQLRAWDGRWSHFVAGLDALSTSATCGEFGDDVECGRRAVEALMCNLDHDLELARGAVFYDEALQGALRDLPQRIRARRVVADEAMRREHERLSCEDVESIWDAQRRLEQEERRTRTRARESDDAAPNATDEDASGDPRHTDESSAPQASPPPTSPAPSTSPETHAPAVVAPPETSPALRFEEAERATRDLVAAFEDLDVVFVDGLRAARRRSVPDALLLAAVDAWKVRWPNVPRDISQLSATGCTVANPTRALTCDVGADLVRLTTEFRAASANRDPVHALERGHASTGRLLGILRGRLRQADAMVRRRRSDPMSLLLADQ